MLVVQPLTVCCTYGAGTQSIGVATPIVAHCTAFPARMCVPNAEGEVAEDIQLAYKLSCFCGRSDMTAANSMNTDTTN